MTNDDTAHQSRKAMVDSVKGKVKEVAGAVTGNDSLTSEGQLEQAEAKERREAIRADAEAKGEAAEARELKREAQLEGARERLDIEADASAVERGIENDAERRKQVVEAAGAQASERALAQVEADARREENLAEADERHRVESAAKEYVAEIDEHGRAIDDANRTEAEAEALRRRAENITDANDLS